MPWKLIFFLAILTFVVFFAGFNLVNASDISFGFATIKNVPIFISLFIAYLAGTLTMLPFMVKNKRRNKKDKSELPPESELPPDVPDIPDLNEEK